MEYSAGLCCHRLQSALLQIDHQDGAGEGEPTNQRRLVDDNCLGRSTTTILAVQTDAGLGRRVYRDHFDDVSKASAMPGKRITDHQVHKFNQHRSKLGQGAAAAKSGISERSARRIEGADALPSQRAARSWRTREDPLANVWDAEVVPLLRVDSELNAVTLLEELQRRHPGVGFPSSCYFRSLNWH